MLVDILRSRSVMFKKVREFFSHRNVIEVDCPIISSAASIDEHIDLITASCSGTTRYLHTSPEYAMKRLLSLGSGDIYQLSHVFRNGECGPRHNPEFTMIEWYRQNFSYEEIIDETCSLIKLFLGERPVVAMTYREAFLKYCKVDPLTATKEQLITHIDTSQYTSIETENKDSLLNIILADTIEPSFNKNTITILKDYPATQAALAKIDGNIAKRFEVFCGGMELANGYQELTDPIEQRQRLLDTNNKRKNPLPIDEYFLQALEQGLPECCGVAVGFDRLMMLQHNTNNISDILPFPWNKI